MQILLATSIFFALAFHGCGEADLADAPRPSVDEAHLHDGSEVGTRLVLEATAQEVGLDAAVEALRLRAVASTTCAAPDAEVTHSQGAPRVELFVCQALEGEALGEFTQLVTANGELYFAEVAKDPSQAGARPLPEGLDEPLWILDPASEERFTGRDIGEVKLSSDMLGYPCVAFNMASDRRDAFGAFTERIAEEHGRLAIVLDERILTAPGVEGGLYGWTQITGGVEGFTESEARNLMTIVQTGPLGTDFQVVDGPR